MVGSSSMMAVYPRVCGGTVPTYYPLGEDTGLSPRVRGNRTSGRFSEISIRSIPACAGEPTMLSRSPAVYTVYPRVCGGTYYNMPIDPAIQGLSPRVRGNLLQVV